jgi:signal transduction histidine kinase/PAS domain-containing protein
MSAPADGVKLRGLILRFSASRLALCYVAFSVLVLALFAVPLWYGWRANYGTLRTYVQAEDMQKMVDTFDREGVASLAAAIEARVGSVLRDEIILLADPAKLRIAGNLAAWPAGVPDAPGTSGLVIDLGDASLRVVASHTVLPGGYRFLMGRESARFVSLVSLFWYGIAGATALALLLGAAVGWLARRALLSEVLEISRSASAIVGGDLSRRVATRGGSEELNTLAELVNGMLEQLARQNEHLVREVAVRRDAEQALHRAHDDLEGVVAQRTAQLALANDSLRRSEIYLGEAQRLSLTGSFGWNVASGELVWSDATYELMGLDRQTKPALAEVLRLAHPEDLDFVRENLARATRDRETLDFEHRFLLDDGSIKYVHVRASASAVDRETGALEYVGAVTDVTALKRSEALLAGEKRLLELMAKGYPLPQVLDSLCRLVEQSVSGSLCGIVLVDPSGRRLEHGAAPGLPSGYNDGIHGRPVNLDSGPCAMAACLNEQVITTDIALETRWKDHGWCQHALAHGLRACWSSPIVASGGKMLGTMALYFPQPCCPTEQHHEIIERMINLASIAIERTQTEETLRRSEQQRRQAQRLEAVGILAGGIAHDFNNLLSAILGYGERALRDAPRESRLRRDIESIVAAGERGRSLVDSVLTFSRSGVGKLVAVHVEGVVREVLDLLHAKLPDDIVVEVVLQAGRAAMQGDPTQIHQILMNLATNAIQAMPSGGTLRVSLTTMHNDTPRTATIGMVAAGDYIVLDVVDSGVGIASDLIDRIFDPFFTTKEVGAGTGLGLSLVHGLVLDMSGAIDLTSAVGSGSTFTVYLPRSGDALDNLVSADVAVPRGRGQRVLVVDDEDSLVRLATETLVELGYAAVGFTSSTAALKAFRGDPEGFDAVVTDERMPEMSGSNLIQVMREANPSIPILLLSGNVGGLVTARAYNAGANEVLKKPLSVRELAVTLARVLQH